MMWMISASFKESSLIWSSMHAAVSTVEPRVADRPAGPGQFLEQIRPDEGVVRLTEMADPLGRAWSGFGPARLLRLKDQHVAAENQIFNFTVITTISDEVSNLPLSRKKIG